MTPIAVAVGHRSDPLRPRRSPRQLKHPHAFVGGRCVACGCGRSREWALASTGCPTMNVLRGNLISTAKHHLKERRALADTPYPVDATGKPIGQERTKLWRMAQLAREASDGGQALLAHMARQRRRIALEQARRRRG